jgi:hypothetical protein
MIAKELNTWSPLKMFTPSKPGTVATQETEIRRIMIQDQSRQNLSKIPFQQISLE